MPSPFPGMDPFLELQEWDDFHYSLYAAIRDALSPRLAPRYVVAQNGESTWRLPVRPIRCFVVRM